MWEGMGRICSLIRLSFIKNKNIPALIEVSTWLPPPTIFLSFLPLEMKLAAFLAALLAASMTDAGGYKRLEKYPRTWKRRNQSVFHSSKSLSIHFLSICRLKISSNSSLREFGLILQNISNCQGDDRQKDTKTGLKMWNWTFLRITFL